MQSGRNARAAVAFSGLLATLLWAAAACTGTSGGAGDAAGPPDGTPGGDGAQVDLPPGPDAQRADALPDAPRPPDARPDAALVDAAGELGPGPDAGRGAETAVSDAAGDGPDGTAAPAQGLCEPNPEPFPVRPDVSEPPTVPWLRVAGTDIVDEADRPVALRGVNFGNWLAIEAWLMGLGSLDEETLLAELETRARDAGIFQLFSRARATTFVDWVTEARTRWLLIQDWRRYCFENATPDELPAVTALWAWFDSQPWLLEEESVWDWLSGRFGTARAEELRTVFHDHYITERDVQRVAELGLNAIRLPVWYRTLETDLVGANGYRPEGWRRLHDAAVWARRHGVYLILDFHGAPGGQSCSAHQGLRTGGQIWQRPDCIGAAARIWQALATYFADEPHIAAYDLLNEPMNCPDREAYETVHRALYAAIRAVDTRHIVMVEDGFLAARDLASPAELGFENAMFSYHFYPWNATSADRYVQGAADALATVAARFARYQCPVLAGEFSAASGTNSGPWAVEASDRTLALLNAHGVHWTLWSWKFYADWALWGVYYPPALSGRRIPVENATFEEIRAEFEALDSAGYAPIAPYAEVLARHAAAPVVPLTFE